MSTSTDVTVSLEPHLVQVLSPLKDRLSNDLRNSLIQELDRTEIHYSLLSRISQWARSEPGIKGLKAAHLEPSDYHMVSLLAGTRTAPSSKPPPYTPPEPEIVRIQRERNERRALAFVINGFLSVLCAGGSSWWAADKIGWRAEWKVLLALAVGSIVGLSETILFIIWQNRSSSKPGPTRLRIPSADKKDDGSGESINIPAEKEHEGRSLLRRRIAPKNER